MDSDHDRRYRRFMPDRLRGVGRGFTSALNQLSHSRRERLAAAAFVTGGTFACLALRSAWLLLGLCLVVLASAVVTARAASDRRAAIPGVVLAGLMVLTFVLLRPPPPYDDDVALGVARSFVQGVMDDGSGGAGPYIGAGLMGVWSPSLDSIHDAYADQAVVVAAPTARARRGTFLVQVLEAGSNRILSIFAVSVGSDGQHYKVIEYSWCAAASGCLEYAGEPGGMPPTPGAVAQ
jgi:hypothetical protein